MAGRKTRAKTEETRRGTAAALADALIANPTATGGTIVMAAMAAAIMTNALALQAGRHPAPLFSDTSPFGAGTTAAPIPESPAADADEIGALLGDVPAVDPVLVTAIQSELKKRGYYEGAVDGLVGPMTSDAILRFEQDGRLRQTGEPTPAVLAEIRAAPLPRAETVRPVAIPPPQPAAVEPVPPSAPAVVPIPKRPPPRAEAAAIRHAATPAEMPAAQPVSLREEEPVVAIPAVREQPAEPAPVGDPKLARVQEALDLLGYGPLRADGFMTADTRAAIRRFEENRALPVTGEINQGFLDELVKIGGFASR